MLGMKRLVKDLTPPLLWRSLRQLSIRMKHQERQASADDERGAGFYDAIWESEGAEGAHYTSSRYYFMWTVIADRIASLDSKSVFDVGCGPGQLSALLRDRGLKRYVGLDFSGKAIEIARANCPEFRFHQADAFTSDLFETLRYDTLITSEFLEHVVEDLKVIKRIPSGTHVIASVPNFDTEGHVRYFLTSKEVYDRYGEFFTDLRIDPFLMRNTTGSTLYLMQGVKK